jgi:hypothetical protein
LPELVNRWTFRTALGGLAIVVAAVVPVKAGPLEAEQCAKLTATIDTLDKAGIKAILEKGPAASKGTLTKDQREQIRSYLDTLASLRFRCPSEAPFVTLKPEPPEDPAEATALTAPIEANTPGITLPPGVAAAIVAPIVPQKPPVPKQPKAAATAPPAAKTGEPPATSPAPAKQKSQPAAKAATPAPPATPPQPPATAPAPPKPKPKAKADDAFKPAPATEPAQPKAPQ